MKQKAGLWIGKLIGWGVLHLGCAGWVMRRYGKALLADVETAGEAREYFIRQAETEQGRKNIADLGLAHEYQRFLKLGPRRYGR